MATAQVQEKTFVWKGIFYNTMELCHVNCKGSVLVFDGEITGTVKGIPLKLSYEIKSDTDYHVTAINISSLYQKVLTVVLKRKSGRWYDEHGNVLPEFDDCEYIDISLTPLTNLFPIKDLRLQPGSSRQINVIYIDPVTDLLKRGTQRYTRADNNTYRYENIASGFVSDLQTDENGYVINYPGAWERLFPEQHNSVYEAPKSISDDFLKALVSAKRSNQIQDGDDIYKPLLGNWKVTVFDYDVGKKYATTGEWHFNRILEGRAVQDVFVSPEVKLRTASLSRVRNRFGTTIRIFDERSGIWKIDWFNPVTGVHNNLIGRADGKRIIQEGIDPDGTMIRWIFDEITKNSFHWTGQESTNQGLNWITDAEFFAKRTK